MNQSSLHRCSWVTDDQLYKDYHDNEWGRPIYNDKLLFEFLVLEGMQAGLNWFTILKKRANFRASFDDFNPELIAKYDNKKINELLLNPQIIRNKLKITAAINNAKSYLNVLDEWSRFSDYIWHFVDGKPIINHWPNSQYVPAATDLSKTMAKDLKKRGFKFVGDTICYAFMQATGMVNDHTTDCFCYNQIHGNQHSAKL